jgi:LmbE family N-acetylglucosaminyl deacetylase
MTTMARQAMVLVAHADDETLGAGGLIQRLLKTGWEVSVVILSDGLLTVRGQVQDNRSDASVACSALGLPIEPIFLNFPDQKFDTIPMANLAGAVATLGMEPDLIISHVETDLNLDHRLVCEVAKIVGRPKKKPVAILGCEVPSTSFWNGAAFPATYYVDITAEIERKIEAFACYRNELEPYPHPWSQDGLRLLAQYHGMQAGYPFAEAYHLVRGYAGLMP